MIVVSDTSPIANLIVVGHLDLLFHLFETVVIPGVVYQELLANGKNHRVTQAIERIDWLDVRSVMDGEKARMLEYERKLDSGEAHAIALALELNATQLLIDERLGRVEAKRQGLKITGLLGVLLAAKKKSLIPCIHPILDDLISKANFRISRQLYDEVLMLANEILAD
ncbi:MAG: DUF3368 domain-containing protein [Cyanobacteria bacterium P01_E01_bin.6]